MVISGTTLPLQETLFIITIITTPRWEAELAQALHSKDTGIKLFNIQTINALELLQAGRFMHQGNTHFKITE